MPRSADSDVDTVLREFGGRGFGEFKPALADLAVARLSPMGQEMRRLLANPGDIDAILEDGGAVPRPSPRRSSSRSTRSSVFWGRAGR